MSMSKSCEALYLREVVHRTGNVLQMAIAAVHLVKRGQPRHLEEAMTRLEGAAALHGLLVQRGEGFVELGKQVELTCDAAGRAAGASDEIELVLDADTLICDAEDARRMSMIVAELVGNCVRHAFPDGQGSILIELRDDGRYTGIMVEDDGACGGWVRPGGQGCAIVDELAAVMRGRVRRQKTPGGSSRIEIVMPSLALGSGSNLPVAHSR